MFFCKGHRICQVLAILLLDYATILTVWYYFVFHLIQVIYAFIRYSKQLNHPDSIYLMKVI